MGHERELSSLAQGLSQAVIKVLAGVMVSFEGLIKEGSISDSIFNDGADMAGTSLALLEASKIFQKISQFVIEENTTYLLMSKGFYFP